MKDDTLDTHITGLIETSTTVSEFLDGLAVRSPDTPHELPCTTKRLDKEFYPPLPGRLFSILVRLPGKAWAVYLVLYQHSCLRKRLTVSLTSVSLSRFGITRKQKYYALAVLEAAQLITLDRTNGKNPTVSLRPEHTPWVKMLREGR
jgi:hypothetical protein